MANYDDLIRQSQDNVKALSDKLQELEQLHQNIQTLIQEAEGMPSAFDKKFQETIKLAENYTNSLGAVTKTYLDGSNKVFTSKLTDFGVKLQNLHTEIGRLVETDFKAMFQGLQQEFIAQTTTDVREIISGFDEPRQDLQTKITALQEQIDRMLSDFERLLSTLKEEFFRATDEKFDIVIGKLSSKSEDLQGTNTRLSEQVERLAAIDLEQHFARHQQKLSEIFGAVNAINATLTTISQTLIDVTRSIGNVQDSVKSNAREIKEQIVRFQTQVSSRLKEQNTEIGEIIQQNLLLQKEIKINRIILICAVIIGGIIAAIIRFVK